MDGATPIPDLLDYHICYSHSYQVPIMCFKAMSLGELLRADGG